MTLEHSRCVKLAILSSILSSVATLFRVQGVSIISPPLAATIGVLFAGLISFSYLAIRGQIPSFETIKRAGRPFIMLTICRPILSNIIFAIGLSMSLGIKAVFLTKMEPYLVIFWVWALDGKRPTSNHLLLLLIHVLGAILLSVGDLSKLDLAWGDLIIFCAVVSAALSYRYSPLVTKVLSPTQASTISETLGGIITLPIALAFCTFTFDQSDLEGWGYIAIHSVLFYVFSIPLLYASLKDIHGWQSSALRSVGPLFAVPIAWIFFGERLNYIQIIGAVIVLITSVLVTKIGKKKELKAGPVE